MSPILAALFPDIRAKILAALVIHLEKPWYLTELATHLGTKPSSLQREGDTLSKAGILAQWRDGRRAYFKADTASPVFPDLCALFEKTAGLVPILQQELDLMGERIRPFSGDLGERRRPDGRRHRWPVGSHSVATARGASPEPASEPKPCFGRRSSSGRQSAMIIS
jgi:hypothetical protein